MERDETYFLYSGKSKSGIEGRKPGNRGGSSKCHWISSKQVCVLVARDRQKSIIQIFLGEL